MSDERARESASAADHRWWVDTGKKAGNLRDRTSNEPAATAGRFFDIGYQFDQEQAKIRLTDSNLKLLEAARPNPGEWSTIRLVPNESVPPERIERVKRRLALPPSGRGVIVDSGRSARFILTGDPVGERILEFAIGASSSFDCWVHGEWVHEELFRDEEDALRRARPFVAKYLSTPPPEAF